MTELTRETIVPFLGEIFARRGAEEYLGEQVTIAEHMLQGAQLAEEAGAPRTRSSPPRCCMMSGISPTTSRRTLQIRASTACTRKRVPGCCRASFRRSSSTACANMWLPSVIFCATDADYFGRLSPASVHSLNLQGGPMSPDEIAEFEKNPNVRDIVQVRVWDDEGKVPGHRTPGFDHYVPLLQRVVDRHLGAGRE